MTHTILRLAVAGTMIGAAATASASPLFVVFDNFTYHLQRHGRRAFGRGHHRHGHKRPTRDTSQRA